MNQATAAPLDRQPARLALADREIDLGAGTLRYGDGGLVGLRPQAWAVLRQLAGNANRLVTKGELFAAVWPGVVVTDASIAQAISEVRAALGEAGQHAIRTVPRRGYMLVAEAPAAEPAQPAALPQRQSVAVLAFSDPHGDAQAQMLARGFARDLLVALACNADRRVVSHHSSFAFAGSETPLAEIGRRLRCRYLVDGTVRRDGDTLHIGVELIDARLGAVVWAERHSVGADTLGATREALVQRIAGSVYARTLMMVSRPAHSPAPKSLDVYELTLRATALWIRFEPAATREARALLERVLRIDPEYAPAWACLGYLNALDDAHFISGEWHRGRAHEYLAQLHRAIALDPASPDACRGLSLALLLVRDFDAARRTAQRALELSPSSAESRHRLAHAQLRLGRVDAALHSIEAALELDPLPAAWLTGMHAAALWGCGRQADALHAASDCLARLPQWSWARATAVFAAAELGRTDLAREHASALLRQLPHVCASVLVDEFADSASSLRERVATACAAAGIPPRAAPAWP